MTCTRILTCTRIFAFFVVLAMSSVVLTETELAALESILIRAKASNVGNADDNNDTLTQEEVNVAFLEEFETPGKPNILGAQALFAQGADVNYERFGRTALYWMLRHYQFMDLHDDAVASVCRAAIKYLLDNGAIVDDCHRGTDHCTYVDMALKSSDTFLIEWIVSAHNQWKIRNKI